MRGSACKCTCGPRLVSKERTDGHMTCEQRYTLAQLLCRGEQRPWKGQAALVGVQLEEVQSWGLCRQSFLCTPPPHRLPLQNLPECRAGHHSPLQPDVVQPAGPVSSTSASCSAGTGLCCSGPWSKQVSQVHAVSPSATAAVSVSGTVCGWTRASAERRRPGGIVSQDAGGGHLLRDVHSQASPQSGFPWK